MIDTKLIMLEGLPATGKSTNSDFLRMQLERNGKKANWIHEVASPHPVLLFFEDPGSWDVSLDQYEEAALKKWARFAETALQDRDTITILDSSMFQAQIFVFLWNNAPYERLEQFVHQLYRIVECLHPSLFYLYRENTEATIDYLEQDRGREGLESIWERDKTRPYYQGKPEGAEGFKYFLRDYANAANLLFDSLDCRKMPIEISEADWPCHEAQMLSFLGIENMPSPLFLPPNGVYRNAELNYKITVDGLTMTDPNGDNIKLTPKNANEFYVACLPIVLHFEDPEQMAISGIQICERWTTTGMRYAKE